MVSSSNQPHHQQPNALFVPSPLILSSSAPTSLTPTNVISSIAQHQQPILFQQQQRPLLFSQQPQMILHGQQNGQLLQKPANGNSPVLKQAMLNQLAQTNAAQQTFLINPNLLPQAQQQILINKHLIDSQRGKPIMLAQHPTNTAHLQSRSQQPLLPNLQQLRSPILASQPSLLNQHQFLGQPIAWPPHQSPLMVQNSLGQFVVNTPTLPQILLPSQQSKEQPMQFVQTPAGGKLSAAQHQEEETGESSGSEIEKVKLNQVKAEKRAGKERRQALKNRKMIGTKMLRNQTKKLRITYKPGHKSTQQMNDELLMFEAQRNADSGSSKSPDGSKESLKTIKRKLKSEKKKISIVKPRVVLTHKVNEYFIHESDHPFPVDGKQAFDPDEVAGGKPKNADPVKVKDGKKLRKYRKLLKTKSASVPPPVNSEPTSSSNDVSSPADLPSTSQPPQLVELSDDDQLLARLPGFCSTDNGLPAVDEANKPCTSSEARNEAETSLDPNIYRWSVDDVHRFALETMSNEEFATSLRRNEFDGQALALLDVSILRNHFDLKLGPILVLQKKIDSYREKSSASELSDYLPAGGENIFRWSVADVSEFVMRLTSSAIAEEFERQEMDGHSLTLITVDNIRNDLNIPYGPALKIINKISELKERAAGK